MVKRPKAKGNLWENQVLRDLRKVIDVAYKSLGSGNSRDDKGDLLTRCFMLECKHVASVKDSDVDRWWRKLTKEAAAANKEPVLVYKQNRQRPMVVFFDKFRGTRRIWMEYENWLDYLKEKGEGEAFIQRAF